LGKRTRKTKKIPSSHPTKEKNWTSHECMLSLLIGCMKPLLPKLFVTIFGTNCGTELEVPEITGRWVPPYFRKAPPHPTSSFGR
jgi:hypothetical protein